MEREGGNERKCPDGPDGHIFILGNDHQYEQIFRTMHSHWNFPNPKANLFFSPKEITSHVVLFSCFF